MSFSVFIECIESAWLSEEFVQLIKSLLSMLANCPEISELQMDGGFWTAGLVVETFYK
jgi:hypothetical protein